MLRNILISVAIAAAAVLALPSMASAAVTFDPSTGTGFVGKGDVQSAFGWNNKTMQENYQDVTFKVVASATYEFECEWYTGPESNRKHHVNTKEASVGVDAGIASDARRTGQFTGWYLTGYEGDAPSAGTEPTDADCGAEGNEMKSIVEGSVQLLEGSEGGIYAVFHSVEVAL